jgi:membrane protein implicated in regulation of membrane protease activity
MFVMVLALLLFAFLPWPLALALYIPIASMSLFSFWKVLQAQRQPPRMGKQAMIGERAEVVSSGENAVDVRYRGELWRAVSSQVVNPGQPVIIEDVEGLTLRVAPLPQPIADQPGGRVGHTPESQPQHHPAPR